MMEEKRTNVYIIGCKGIPANYGGYETFVEMLTKEQKNKNIQYHVACAVDQEEYTEEKSRYEHNGAKCYVIPWKKIGAARAIVYDIEALKLFINHAKENQIESPIFYILACRIGPFIGKYKKQIEQIGGKLYVNPDGHEWMRAKWSAPVRYYWKQSERLMVKHADLLVCDSKNIESYIQDEYKKYQPATTFIAYGANIKKSTLADDDESLNKWYQSKGLSKNNYYLVVGRFVAENNYETMIREFMKSKTKKDFALITNVSDKFLNTLKKTTHFESDPRIKFVGTVYDEELLKKIRENAFAYFHGHEVGGTNPSLLEALASTQLNLLLNVGFNKEVAEDGALYWDKQDGSLATLISEAEELDDEKKQQIQKAARARISEFYTWDYINGKYERLFTE